MSYAKNIYAHPFILAVGLLLVWQIVAATAQPGNFQVFPNASQDGTITANPNPAVLQIGQPLPIFDYPDARRPSRPADQIMLTQPNGIDLNVTFINRTPMYQRYCLNYPNGIPILCAGTESDKRWPDSGEDVLFRAHVVNKGTQTSPTFSYKWYIDGLEVTFGSYGSLDAGAATSFTYTWPWGHIMEGERVVDDHTIRFTVDPDDTIAETFESNNSIEDRTNALGLRIAITPDMYSIYNTPLDTNNTYSAEDWLQRQITAMNWALANSTYATTPSGATERVRINSIEITPSAPLDDGTADGGWFVDADYRLVSGGYDPVTDIDWALVHELSHQVGLIDLYNLDIPAPSVEVLDQAGNAANIGFRWPDPGLMGGGSIDPHSDSSLYSSHSAAGISATKGYRRGYYGEYQFDIPAQNYLLVLDNEGNPAANVQITMYQRNGMPDWIGDLAIDQTPEIVGSTAADGRFLLPNRSASGGITTHTEHTLADNPFGKIDVVGRQNRFLVKLNKEIHEEFLWLDITAFNLAFWQGNTLSNIMTLQSHIPPDDNPLPPSMMPAQIKGAEVTFCWLPSPSPNITGYYVYRAAEPTYTNEQISGLIANTCYTETYNGSNRVYAVTAINSSNQESGFSHFIWAPRLINPHDLTLGADGNLIVLDPQNGYALLKLQSDGRYMQNIGSPHYHLEYSRFLTTDEESRLIFSHPRDYYSSRHSVRVADSAIQPLFEFGEQGSAPGEFETPAGVATWGDPCTYGGPYTEDANTLLLTHFDNSYTGESGEFGTASGTSFSTGQFNEAVWVDGNDTLSYATVDNLNRTQGAIEFWLQPGWNGNDNQSYTFFETGAGWFNRMRIMKDGANNLRFMVWDSATEYGIAYNVAHWLANDWHHIAVTWQGNDLSLIVDGEQKAATNAANLPDFLASSMYIGSSHWLDQQANAAIDELRISDIPRAGEPCTFHFLVVDSGNNRVQAFDALGNFVASYGSFGNGTGQFNNPQDIGVDADGRIIVVDSGNHRLQVLSFDGSTFDFLQMITANLDTPVAIDIDPSNYMAIADTANNTIKLMNHSGNLIQTYSSPNDAYSGSFHQPHGVLIHRNGTISVADTGNQRVVQITQAVPTAPTDVSIAQVGNTLELNWTENQANDGYEIWRNTSPYFHSPASTMQVSTPNYTDNSKDIVGDTAVNYYYVVLGVKNGELTVTKSNQVAEFDFAIISGGS